MGYCFAQLLGRYVKMAHSMGVAPLPQCLPTELSTGFVDIGAVTLANGSGRFQSYRLVAQGPGGAPARIDPGRLGRHP